jgi:hypothetical protein
LAGKQPLRFAGLRGTIDGRRIAKMSGGQKSRIEQREDLIYSLATLVDPIKRLIASGEDFLPQVPFVRSQFLKEALIFRNQVEAFCVVGGLTFSTEIDEILRTLSGFSGIFDMVRNPDNWGAKAQEAFVRRLEHTKYLIRSVPCDDPDEILPAASPFQSYHRLRPIFASVGTRLHLFDPYLDASVYHRYLAEVPDNVPIVVVTGEDNMTASGKRNTRRRREIVVVSELFAAERPTTYRLLVSSALHDRHVRADSTIYHLGGSIKDAGAKAPFTLSKQSSPMTDASLDVIVASAVEWFGPGTPTHRRRA